MSIYLKCNIVNFFSMEVHFVYIRRLRKLQWILIHKLIVWSFSGQIEGIHMRFCPFLDIGKSYKYLNKNFRYAITIWYFDYEERSIALEKNKVLDNGASTNNIANDKVIVYLLLEL